MAFRKPPSGLVELFGSLVPPLAEPRRMFGMPSAFLHGHLFMGLFESDMFVRLAEEDREKLLTHEGSHLFAPMPSRPMREYVVVPIAMHEDEAELKKWVERAFAFADSLPPKGTKPAKKAAAKKAAAKKAPAKKAPAKKAPAKKAPAKKKVSAKKIAAKKAPAKKKASKRAPGR